MTKFKLFLILYMEFIVYNMAAIALTALFVIVCSLTVTGIMYAFKDFKRRE